MANTDYLIANRLIETVRNTRKVVALSVGALALGLTAIFPEAGWFVIPLTGIVAFKWGLFQLGAAQKAGGQGEDLTLNRLKRLPDEYTLFNQLEIPSERSRTGEIELDLVVVGPNGLFVIEVKHHNGTIYGNQRSRQWRVKKVGRRGGEYDATLRNPIRQLGGQIAALKAYLKTQSVGSIWIEGVVYFSHPEAQVLFQGESPELLLDHRTDLARLLCEHRPRSPFKKQAAVEAALIRLRPASLAEPSAIDNASET